MNCFGKYAKAGTAVFALLKRLPKRALYPKPGLPMLSIVILGIDPYPKPGLPFFTSF
jgi:hypothetical protein